MSLVGLRGEQLLSPFIVELVHQVGVGEPSFVRCHLHNGIVLPQSVVASERLYAAFGRHACACKEYYVFVFCVHDVSF